MAILKNILLIISALGLFLNVTKGVKNFTRQKSIQSENGHDTPNYVRSIFSDKQLDAIMNRKEDTTNNNDDWRVNDLSQLHGTVSFKDPERENVESSNEKLDTENNLVSKKRKDIELKVSKESPKDNDGKMILSSPNDESSYNPFGISETDSDDDEKRQEKKPPSGPSKNDIFDWEDPLISDPSDDKDILSGSSDDENILSGSSENEQDFSEKVDEKGKYKNSSIVNDGNKSGYIYIGTLNKSKNFSNNENSKKKLDDGNEPLSKERKDTNHQKSSENNESYSMIDMYDTDVQGEKNIYSDPIDKDSFDEQVGDESKSKDLNVAKDKNITDLTKEDVNESEDSNSLKLINEIRTLVCHNNAMEARTILKKIEKIMANTY